MMSFSGTDTEVALTWKGLISTYPFSTSSLTQGCGGLIEPIPARRRLGHILDKSAVLPRAASQTQTTNPTKTHDRRSRVHDLRLTRVFFLNMGRSRRPWGEPTQKHREHVDGRWCSPSRCTTFLSQDVYFLNWYSSIAVCKKCLFHMFCPFTLNHSSATDKAEQLDVSS